jgi:hypothetical protein
MKVRIVLLICATLVTVAGCQSAPPTKLSDVQEGQWRAKALIKDREANKSYIVNLNFNARRNRSARMDVTTTLGMGVASLLVDSGEARYILLDSKRFYYGVPQPGIMRPILAIPFDPRWLQNILFDIPFKDASWSCEQGKDGFLASCVNNDQGLKLTWTARSGDHRTVLIEHNKASVQLNMTSFKPKVEERKNLFTLEAPDGYQKLHVH